MADAKKCDRCGEFYNNEPRPSFIIIKNTYSFPCIDLCPKCIEELKKWLELKNEI